MSAFKRPAVSTLEAPAEIHQDTKIVGKLAIAFVAMLVLSGIAYLVFESGKQGPVVSASTRVDVSNLLTVTDFATFDKQLDAKMEQAGKTGLDRAYLEALVDRVSDPTEIETILPANTYVSSKAPATLAEGSRVLHHDVNMIGGRATYALHRLTGKTMPAVKASDDLARLTQIRSQVRELVLRQ